MQVVHTTGLIMGLFSKNIVLCFHLCDDSVKDRSSGYIHFSGCVGKEACLSVLLFLRPVVWFCDYNAVSSEIFNTMYFFPKISKPTHFKNIKIILLSFFNLENLS